jgi:hypothetical protein
MKNEIFTVWCDEKDEDGNSFKKHVTKEVNTYIVWFSRYHHDNREYYVERVFRDYERDQAILYAVERSKGVCL